MDDLIRAVQKFGVSQNENMFNNSLNVIINNYYSCDQFRNSIHVDWFVLKSNYSKLQFLQETINFYYIKETDLFLECLEKFMKYIDTLTMEYLSNMYNKTIPVNDRSEFEQIEILFQNSLNEPDVITRMANLLKGYDIFVPLVEKYIKNNTVDTEIKECQFRFKRQRL